MNKLLKLFLIILALCGTSYPAAAYTEYDLLVAEPATFEEREMISKLREACRHDRADAPVESLLALLRLEEVLGVDKWRPGLLAGVWCVEAGWRGAPSGEMEGQIWGDMRNGIPQAWGPLQLWPVHRNACSGTQDAPHDLIWAARCWVTRVESVRAKALARCPEADAWGVAEAAVSNHRKYRWRCKSRSKHWKVAEGVDDAS